MTARPPLDQQVTFIYAPDPAPCWAFYGEVLGLKLVLDQGSCRIFQAAPNAFLGVCRNSATAQMAPGEGRQKGVIITLVSSEIDDWHAYLKEKGVAIEKPPTLNAEYNIYHVFVRDPQGYLVEIQAFRYPSWPRPVRG